MAKMPGTGSSKVRNVSAKLTKPIKGQGGFGIAGPKKAPATAGGGKDGKRGKGC